ncbi:MAG: hypothetical protein SW833_25460 [Cyanobacteriota bacterium]|nr:hypothetical protein [Cyanobacteriota bacterium]
MLKCGGRASPDAIALKFRLIELSTAVQIQDCVGWELPLKSWIQQILSPLAMPTINGLAVVGKRFFRFLVKAGLITLPTLQFLVNGPNLVFCRVGIAAQKLDSTNSLTLGNAHHTPC